MEQSRHNTPVREPEMSPPLRQRGGAFRSVVLFAALSIIGIALIPKLSTDLNPDYTLPSLSITYSLPNASPEIVEQMATSPLENAFSQLSELKEIKSVSNYHRGSVTLIFDKHADIRFKKFEVSSIIRQIYPKLNPNVQYPVVSQSATDNDDNASPILIYSINAPAAPFHIKKVVEDVLKKSVAKIDGLKEVAIRGATGLQITLDFDHDQLLQHQLTFQEVSAKIRQNFEVTFPGSLVNAAGQTLFIKSGKSFDSIDEISDIVVKNENYPIKIGDLADVYLEEKRPVSHYRINGNNSITMSIYASEGENNILLAEKTDQVVKSTVPLLPKGYGVTKDYDDTEYLGKELNKIYKRSGLSILILIVLIFLINRKINYLIILFSGIIINLCLTSIALYFLNVKIHLYSLAGITISFGLIVDNAIVMIDHIRKKNNTRIFVALLAASLTTIVALLIILLLPDEERQNLTEFAQVIIINLGISLLIALFYTPAISQLLFRRKDQLVKHYTHKRKKWLVKLSSLYLSVICFLSKYKKTFVTFLVLVFGLPVFLLPAKWGEHNWYNATIGSDYYQENIRPISDKILGGSLRMFVRNVYERSGYRTPEKTKLFVTATLPYGNTLERMDHTIREVEDYLKGFDGVEQFISRVNSGQNARIVITFKPAYENGSFPYILKSRLISRSLDWGGVDWSVSGVGKGFSNASGEQIPSYRVTMKGYNYDELERQANILSEKLLTHKRIQKVNTNERLSYREKSSKEFVLHLNRGNIASLGLDYQAIINRLTTISPPVSPALHLVYEDVNTPIYFQTKNSDEFSKYTLTREVLPADHERSFKMTDLSDLRLETTANTIHKENRQYIRVVGFEYFGSHKFGNQYLDKVLEEMENEMPIGYEAKKEFFTWGSEKAKRQYGLLLIAMVMIFFICSILTENLKQPFYIIITVPLSFIGLFLIFSIFDFYFDQGGYAAFVMLGGLVVNAAIFIVNDFNNLKKGHYNRNVIKAVSGKAQPIFLTILSTCFGLIPFVMEGQNEIFWFSLAIGTIGGLIFSLFAVFVCLPVFMMKRSMLVK